MADTGFKTAGNVVSTGTWANFTTTQLATSDNLRATATSAAFVTGTLNNFTFGLTSGVTIDGIEIQAEFSANNTNTAELQLSLSWNNGTNYTATKLDSVVNTTDTVRTYGGSADTWGRSWADSEFANGTFVAKLEGRGTGGASCRVDYFAIKVYYTTATSTGNFLLLF